MRKMNKKHLSLAARPIQNYFRNPVSAVLRSALCLLLVGLHFSAGAQPDNPALSNSMCGACHNNPSLAMPGPDGNMRQLHVSSERFSDSVHGSQDCVGCHQDIQSIPHRKNVDRGIGCIQCHRSLWDEARLEGTAAENQRLGEVVDHIEGYLGSIHARPSMADQGRTNATCYDCHDAHYIESINGDEPDRASRLNTPQVCGRCHQDALADYEQSVHGMGQQAGNIEAAVCIDCHTPHNIDATSLDSNKLVITENCGSCHQDAAESYQHTYHGQVNKLGYAYTAKCFDCHGSHDIRRLEDPASRMHMDNRLESCQSCHENATAGYASFEPHGTAHDFERYPQIWIAQKFMIGLLVGTFAFFWLHSALWFYREYRDRKEGKNRPHINTEELPAGGKTHFRRFNKWWRLGHLIGALSIMILVLTGVAVMYAESAWAPGLMALLGGPKSAAIIHRIAALGFIGVFFIHLVYFAFRIGRNLKTFQWFGPNSLIPNWQDFKDIYAMFNWFIGKAPRPALDRWSYWEKFDYWAPFWGMMIIGISGMMMWFPSVTATYLPGWVFNVATIVHGEEAFLAAVFLFTVHFFNNHFRPDKFPQDTTMFTGVVPLDVYIHEHRRDYERLKASGELEKYLVEAPSSPMRRGSRMLGATLIMFGLFLLTLVLLGFLGI
ncbi:MAG: cytochrome C [Xanthomonadales bacterium]|nr:cytochrome C [Xanthomonadales bacterium]NNL96009.1 cytochrome C [Xanthomonadales bacterium]